MVDSITLNTSSSWAFWWRTVLATKGGVHTEYSRLELFVCRQLIYLGVLRYSELVRNMAGHGGLPPSLQQHYASGDGLLGVTATATVFSTNSFRPPATLSATVFSLRYVSV